MDFVDTVVIGGGQAGLATAHAALSRGRKPVVLDASPAPGGSWPHYYDSLKLFSPVRFSSLPGLPFPGEPNSYPVRDEVVAYLSRYAAWLGADVRWGSRVEHVTRGQDDFDVTMADGSSLRARSVIAASGGFGRPYRPELPGLADFTGVSLHSAEYRNPAPYAGARVLVVGGGNSAVQIGAELARVARVSLATRGQLRWQAQRILGRDFHWWLTRTGLDSSALGPRLFNGTVPVIDDGRYRAAVDAGRPDRRPMFSRIDGDSVIWSDGSRETVDVLILATGFPPDLGVLERHTGARRARAAAACRRGVDNGARSGVRRAGASAQLRLGNAPRCRSRRGVRAEGPPERG